MSGDESAISAARPRPGRILPPVWFWLLMLVLISVNVWARMPDTLDSAIANIIAGVSILVIATTFVVWFGIGSGHPPHVAWAPAATVVGLCVLAAATRKIDYFTAELIPVTRWRWMGAADELLAKPAASPGAEKLPLDAATDNDFPQFLGPHRDLGIDRITLARDWQARPPKLIWRHPIGAGHSAFSAVNGYAVTMEQRGEDELVTCYDLMTGELKWSHGIAVRHHTVLGRTGPRSTPTISGGRVYAMGATGVLRCLDSGGGRVWSKNLLEETGTPPADEASQVQWGRSGSPLVVDHTVVVPGGGPKDGQHVSLVAFDKETGTKLWQAGNHQISYASPSLARLGGVRQILIVNEDSVSGHNAATGAVLWDFKWEGSSSSNASASQAVPVGDDRIFISKGYLGGSSLFSVKHDDKGNWTVAGIWHHQKNLQTKMTNVVVHKGYVYGLSDGILECVELNDGQRRWKGGHYGHGQILRVGELLLVGTSEGEIVLVELTPDEHRELGRFQAIEGQTWNNLCLYGRYLLVRNSDEAACYELPLEGAK